jgi:HK97 family phage major capsid protein
MLNSVEIREAISNATVRAKEIVELCRTEVREMNDEEKTEFDNLRAEIDNKKAELKELEEKLRSYEEDVDNMDEDEKEDTEETRNKSNKNTMKKQSLIKEIRNAIDNNVKSFTINAEKRADAPKMQVTGESGVHDAVVETEIEGILEPLYANSVLSQLGARWYTGLPHGDVQIPIMGAGQCGWAGEVAAASATANEFTTVLLQPKRLTAYVDISKQLIAQDTIGVEAAIRRDIVNALNDKLEATIFGSAEGTATQPGGLFYNVTPEEITDYAGLCAFEAELDDANINGQKKYLMGNTAKATFRSMIKGTNATGMVMEANQIDGTPMLNTSNVKTKEFVYGDFNYLAVASWGDIEITVDQYTQAVNGCIRLVINAFFDAKVLRPEAFVFGTVDAE